jgi:hypothetical protein
MRKTKGVSPKVPAQAVATLAVAALAYFGVDLSPEVSAAIGVVVGIVAGWFAAPGVVVTEPPQGPGGHGPHRATAGTHPRPHAEFHREDGQVTLSGLGLALIVAGVLVWALLHFVAFGVVLLVLGAILLIAGGRVLL